MDFAGVFAFLIEAFKRENIDFALIGGFALQAVGLTRTTKDIDLLILSDSAEKVKSILLKKGYDLVHESEDVFNFVSKDSELGRIDFLLAHRKYALEMLKRAQEMPVLGGKFKAKVLKIEDLIGLKVQATSNDPQRISQDLVDIKVLIRDNRDSLDMSRIKEYFKLFDRKKELDKIIEEIDNVK